MAANDSLTQDIFLEVHVSILYLIIIFPICVFILYLGFKQWKSKVNDPSWFINYSDFFTYNLVLMELVGIVAYAATLCVIFSDYKKGQIFLWVGSFAWYGEIVFPVCVCIEHYIAVVHPMTYLSLKNGKGRLIRNISTGLVWVVTLVAISTVLTIGHDNYIFFFVDVCLTIVYLSIIFYSSVVVLKVLIHPKPGGAIRDKCKVEKSKYHAFFVIVLILVVLTSKFCLNVIFNVFWALKKIDLSYNDKVVLGLLSYWINVLTSLLLPLLYLQRAGKLQQCGRTLGIVK